MVLSPYYAIKTGARQIANGAADLAQIAQETFNNADESTDREALSEMKTHLDAVHAAATALERAVLARCPK